jgi:hypothetical protein
MGEVHDAVYLNKGPRTNGSKIAPLHQSTLKPSFQRLVFKKHLHGLFLNASFQKILERCSTTRISRNVSKFPGHPKTVKLDGVNGG